MRELVRGNDEAVWLSRGEFPVDVNESLPVIRMSACAFSRYVNDQVGVHTEAVPVPMSAILGFCGKSWLVSMSGWML